MVTLSCDAEGPGDFRLCLARFGNTGESFLGSCGMLCHLRGLLSLLPREGEPSLKDVFRGGVGESVSMLFLSSCSNSSDINTGLNITFKASSSSLDLAKKFFLVKGALLASCSASSTNKYFFGALGDYTIYEYHKKIYGTPSLTFLYGLGGLIGFLGSSSILLAPEDSLSMASLLKAGQLVRTTFEELLASSIAYPLHYIVSRHYVNRNKRHAHHRINYHRNYPRPYLRVCMPIYILNAASIPLASSKIRIQLKKEVAHVYVNVFKSKEPHLYCEIIVYIT